MSGNFIHQEVHDSWCTSGDPVYYCWVNGPALEGQDAIDRVLDEVDAILDAWDWNEYTRANELGALEAVLERAQNGLLVNVDEIKPLRRGFPFRMFEIRHEVVAASHVKVLGRVVDRREEKVLIRIYHAEEANLPRHALASRVSRKVFIKGNDEETERLQDAEIDAAVEVLERGKPNRWGLL